MSATPVDFMLGLAITAMQSVHNDLAKSERDIVYTIRLINKYYAACVGMNPAVIEGSNNYRKSICSSEITKFKTLLLFDDPIHIRFTFQYETEFITIMAIFL